MAFGIDDVFSTAKGAVGLTETVVRTVQTFRAKKPSTDVEHLIEEVRVSVLVRIDEADRAMQRMLRGKGVDTNKPLQSVIESTPWWRPAEAHRLKRIRRDLDALAGATYDGVDDIAALARCRDQTGEMGVAVIESAKIKDELNRAFLAAESADAAIDLLRQELVRHKLTLTA